LPVLLTPRIRFLHTPKTGGTWAWRALQAAGVPVEAIGGDPPHARTSHLGLSRTEEYADRFTIAFVRHPLTWWRSLWAYRMGTDWAFAGEDMPRSEDFDTYIEQAIELRPGHLENYFARWIGPASDPIDFIGRFESLVDDLVRAMREAGEPFDEPALRAHPPDNVADYERFPAFYRRDLAERLADSERATIDRFYAGEPIPAGILAPAPPLRRRLLRVLSR
jgi:hypothetical protein